VARRVPNDLYWIALWAVGAGLFLLADSAADAGSAGGLVEAAGGALLLAVVPGLLRLQRWARVAGALVLAALGATAAAALFRDEVTTRRVLTVVMSGYATVYLLAGSTRRLFGEGGPARLTLQGAAPVLLATGALAALAAAGLPRPVVLGLAGAGVLVYLVSARSWDRRLSLLLTPRPPGLDPAAWRRFRRARAARVRGDLDDAAARLEALGDDPVVALERDLLALDRARREGGLERVVLDAEFEPRPSEARRIAAACREADLEALLTRRAELIDRLVADAADPRSCFAFEYEHALEALTGVVFVNNPESQFRRWWAERRVAQAGPAGLRWLVFRLWKAECPDAALAVAARTDDELLQAAAGLARLLDSPDGTPPPVDRLEELVLLLALPPQVADGLGLFLVDDALVVRHGPAWVRAVTGLRRRLVDWLRQAWADCPEDVWLEASWLLRHLTGAPLRLVRARARFERWWAARRAAQERFEESMARGVAAAAEEAWQVAEAAFARAAEAWPERTCAPYDRACALLALGRADEALPLLQRLAEAEPKEGRWRRRLGDALANVGRLDEAAATYQRAMELGELEPKEPAAERGLRLAAEGKADEARELLDKVTADADPADLDRVVLELESRGEYELARRYQDRAFRRALQRREAQGFDPDEDEGEGESPTGELA